MLCVPTTAMGHSVTGSQGGTGSVTAGQGSEIYDGSFPLCLPGVANVSVLPGKPCIGGLSAVNRKLIINCDSNGPLAVFVS